MAKNKWGVKNTGLIGKTYHLKYLCCGDIINPNQKIVASARVYALNSVYFCLQIKSSHKS